MTNSIVFNCVFFNFKVGGYVEPQDVKDKAYESDFLATGGFSSEYLERMSQSGHYGDGVVLAYAAHLYKRPVIVLSDSAPIVFDVPTCGDVKPIKLGWLALSKSSAKNHYVSAYSQPCAGIIKNIIL